MTTQETKPAAIGKEVKWAELLAEALTMPGSMGNTYSRFYKPGYSMGNTILLYMQGVREPVNTYKRFAAMGRQVLKGSKAKTIMAPMIYSSVNDDGEKEKRIKGFKYLNCLFTVSQTEGADLPPAEPRTWDKAKALGALAITEVPFTLLDGNVQGFSHSRSVSVSPVAAYPVKTLMHEIAHIEHNHTTAAGTAEYQTHRGLMEVEAEASAFLVMNELELTEHADMSESRAYLQNWLGHQTPPEASIRRIFTVTDRIIRAGWVGATE